MPGIEPEFAQARRVQAAGLPFRDRLTQPDDLPVLRADQPRQPGDEARGRAAVGDMGGEDLVRDAAREAIPDYVTDIVAGSRIGGTARPDGVRFSVRTPCPPQLFS